MAQHRVIMDRDELMRKIKRMSTEILDDTHGGANLALIGIRSMGVHLAKRIKKELESMLKTGIPLGILDITLYRDDISRQPIKTTIKETILKFDMTGKHIILIDDVIWSGRTVRAALDQIMDFGRPDIVRLGVLIDRGERELPIEPNFTGNKIEVREDEWIELQMKETKGKDQVLLFKKND